METCNVLVKRRKTGPFQCPKDLKTKNTHTYTLPNVTQQKELAT